LSWVEAEEEGPREWCGVEERGRKGRSGKGGERW
jgi:hypothetical protein